MRGTSGETSRNAANKESKARHATGVVGRIAMAVGASLLAIGVTGMTANAMEFREYEESADVRTTTATVLRTHEGEGIPDVPFIEAEATDDGDTVPADVTFSVDGSGRYYGQAEVPAGVIVEDYVPIEVYQRKDGSYVTPSVTSERSLARTNAPLVATVAAGVVVVATGLAMVLRKGTAAARA